MKGLAAVFTSVESFDIAAETQNNQTKQPLKPLLFSFSFFDLSPKFFSLFRFFSHATHKERKRKLFLPTLNIHNRGK